MKKLRFSLEVVVVAMSGCDIGCTSVCFEYDDSCGVDIGTQKELIDEKIKRTDSA